MKSESTIRRQMKKLRSYIDAANATSEYQRDVRAAYLMECALQWALASCDWTPMEVVNIERELLGDGADGAADGGS